MISRKAAIVAVVSFVLAMTFVATNATRTLADDFDQAIKLTFNQPLAIPEQTLPPGSYWFVVAAHGDLDRNIIVYDGDRKKAITTLNVAPDQQVSAPHYVSGRVMVTIVDRSPKPSALTSLTYPGREFGHSFTIEYSKQEREAMKEYPSSTMKINSKGEMEKVDVH